MKSSKFDEYIAKWVKPRPPVRGAVVVTSRRVYILPTSLGLSYAFAVIIILIGSLNYQSSLGFLLSFLLFSLGLVVMVKTQRNLADLTVNLDDAAPVFEGEVASFPLTVSTAKVPRPSIGVFSANSEREVFDVAPEASVLLRVGELKRGVHVFGRLTMETTFPLGLFRSWTHVQSGVEVVVYPKPLEGAQVAEWLSTGPDKNEGNGAGKTGGAEDFWGLREYVAGDAPARVNWKGFARTGTLTVKEFELPAASLALLDFKSLGRADLETRLSLLTGLVLRCSREKIPYLLRLPSLSVGPGAGEEHKRACLLALARFSP